MQQKQGRVKPTIQMKDGVNINDDDALENEADEMGTEAKKQSHHMLEKKSYSLRGNNGIKNTICMGNGYLIQKSGDDDDEQDYYRLRLISDAPFYLWEPELFIERVKGTNEFKSLMDENLEWQDKYEITENIAMLTCIYIIEDQSLNNQKVPWEFNVIEKYIFRAQNKCDSNNSNIIENTTLPEQETNIDDISYEENEDFAETQNEYCGCSIIEMPSLSFLAETSKFEAFMISSSVLYCSPSDDSVPYIPFGYEDIINLVIPPYVPIEVIASNGEWALVKSNYILQKRDSTYTPFQSDLGYIKTNKFRRVDENDNSENESQGQDSGNDRDREGQGDSGDDNSNDTGNGIVDILLSIATIVAGVAFEIGESLVISGTIKTIDKYIGVAGIKTAIGIAANEVENKVINLINQGGRILFKDFKILSLDEIYNKLEQVPGWVNDRISEIKEYANNAWDEIENFWNEGFQLNSDGSILGNAPTLCEGNDSNFFEENWEKYMDGLESFDAEMQIENYINDGKLEGHAENWIASNRTKMETCKSHYLRHPKFIVNGEEEYLTPEEYFNAAESAREKIINSSNRKIDPDHEKWVEGQIEGVYRFEVDVEIKLEVDGAEKIYCLNTNIDLATKNDFKIVSFFDPYVEPES